MTAEQYGALLKASAKTDMRRFHSLYGYTASYRNPNHPSPRQDSVLKAVNNGASTIDELEDIIGGSRKTIHNTLALLIDKKMINRIKRGVYGPCLTNLKNL